MSAKKENLSNHVVVFNEALNAHHHCTAAQYNAAKDQPGYNWELLNAFESENEASEFIVSDREARRKAAIEAQFKGLNKEEIIDLLISNGLNQAKDSLSKMTKAELIALSEGL